MTCGLDGCRTLQSVGMDIKRKDIRDAVLESRIAGGDDLPEPGSFLFGHGHGHGSSSSQLVSGGDEATVEYAVFERVVRGYVAPNEEDVLSPNFFRNMADLQHEILAKVPLLLPPDPLPPPPSDRVWQGSLQSLGEPATGGG